jgi:archaellum biogenesis ATPase FlaH
MSDFKTGQTPTKSHIPEVVQAGNKPDKKTIKKVIVKSINKPLYQVIEENRDVARNYKKVLGSLIGEGDITIFWGSSGSGKSLVSYQLAQAVASGCNFFDVMKTSPYENLSTDSDNKYYSLVNELPAQKVIYVDYEMTGGKISHRYSYYNQNGEYISYKPHENLILSQFKNSWVNDKSLFLKDINNTLKEYDSKFIIIDNLSNLSTNGSEAEFAGQLMYQLKDIVRERNATMVLLNHTNKIPELEPKEPVMMKGSTNFLNFCDSMFCISKTSKDPSVRYIKQHKCRYSEEQFTKRKVIEIELLQRADNANLGFGFVSYQKENDMLKERETTFKEAIKLKLEEDNKITMTQMAHFLYPLYGDNGRFDSFERRCLNNMKEIKKYINI